MNDDRNVVQAIRDQTLVTALLASSVWSLRRTALYLAHALAVGDDARATQLRESVDPDRLWI